MKRKIAAILGSVSLLAAGAAVVSNLLGHLNVTEAKADLVETTTTVYFAKTTDYAVKINVKATNESWHQNPMVKTGKTHYGEPIYAVTFTCPTNDIYDVYFRFFDGETAHDEIQIHAVEGRTNISDFDGKIYYAPGSRWDAYNFDETIITYCAIPTATLSTYSLKLNVNRSGDGDDWQKVDMVPTGYSRGDVPIYSGSFTQWYGGIHTLEFLLEGSDGKNAPIWRNWTSSSTYSGQIYLWNSGWVGPYSNLEAMANWAGTFIAEEDFCDVGGDTLWASHKASFESLDPDVIWFFNNAVANNAGDDIQKAAFRYDKAIDKGMAEFDGAGTNRHKPSALALNISNVSSDSENVVPVMAVFAGVAIFGLGCYFLRRKVGANIG